MSLVDAVRQRLDLDEEQAIRGLGTMFIAVRMTVDAKTFARVAAAYPDAGAWMQAAPFRTGHTGEMLAMATPGAVRRVMGYAGFREADVPVIGGIVGAAVKDAIPEATYRELVETLPMLSATEE